MNRQFPDGPIVFFGASYIAGWNVTHLAGIPVVNKGIPGNQTHELVARFEDDVVPCRPRAVLIWGIDNDVIRTPRERIEEGCERVGRNLERLVAMARTHGIEPILVTDLTLRPPNRWLEGVAAVVGTLRGRQSYQDYINGHVLRLNGFIRDLARRENVLLLDLHPLVSGPGGMRRREYAQDDGSHLTPAGYRVLEAYVTPRIEQWFGEAVAVRAAHARR
ncbi:MAG TPA: GDSL-type esterase/lipase family protein [Vicinamibacterales bacterium]